MKKTQNKKVGYVDGYVLAVPKKNIARYRKDARDAGKIWMKYGALSVKECVADDLAPDTGGHSILPFPKMIKLKKDETLWYSYIEYSSKAHRNAVNKKVTKEMEEYAKKHPDHMKKNMPFDLKRMAYGGFKVSVGL